MEVEFTKLTVCFDGQFWIGIFEIQSENKLSVCRYVFGAEPKDSDIYDLILNKWKELKFSPTVAVEKILRTSRNPKVRQRKIKTILKRQDIGTKAQQAIKLQTEQRKTERKAYNKVRRENEKQLQFTLRQQQKKEKHKGH